MIRIQRDDLTWCVECRGRGEEKDIKESKGDYKTGRDG